MEQTPVERFKNLIADMDVPAGRVEALPDSIVWFCNNLGIRNQTHPNYEEAARLAYQIQRKWRKDGRVFEEET